MASDNSRAMAALLRCGIAKLEDAQCPSSFSNNQVRSAPTVKALARSAKDFGDGRHEGVVKCVEESVVKHLKEIHIDNADTLRPRKFIDKLSCAKCTGMDATSLLYDKAKLVRIESKANAVSSSRSWRLVWAMRRKLFGVGVSRACQKLSMELA